MTTPTQCHLWQKELLTKEDLSFHTVKKLVESSHLDRSVLKCKQCGQLYFHEFYEEVDWLNGNDKMYTTYIPIEEQDIAKLENNSPLELLGRVPRLQWDNDNKIVWIGREEKQHRVETGQWMVDNLNRNALGDQEENKSLTNKPTSEKLEAMKTLLSKPLLILIAITCLVIISYFSILTYKELRPKTYYEQKMHCLELGSNARAQACIRLLNQQGK